MKPKRSCCRGVTCINKVPYSKWPSLGLESDVVGMYNVRRVRWIQQCEDTQWHSDFNAARISSCYFSVPYFVRSVGHDGLRRLRAKCPLSRLSTLVLKPLLTPTLYAASLGYRGELQKKLARVLLECSFLGMAHASGVS